MPTLTKVVTPRTVRRIKVSFAGINVNSTGAVTDYPACGVCGAFKAGGTYGTGDIVLERVADCAFVGCLTPSGLSMLEFGTTVPSMLRVIVLLGAHNVGAAVAGSSDNIRGAAVSVQAWVENPDIPFSPIAVECHTGRGAAIFEGFGKIECWDSSLQITATNDSPFGDQRDCETNGGAGWGGTATVTLTCDAADGTNACGDGSGRCFQAFTAVFNCDSASWSSGPTAGDKLCLPVGTDTSWRKLSSDATTCTYIKYVPCGDAPCGSNADCAAAPDATAPSLPFGGGTASDCCPCDPSIVHPDDAPRPCCTSDTPCSFCADNGSKTPNVVMISFFAIGASTYCLIVSGAGGFVYRVKSNLDGNTYQFDQDPDNPCMYVCNMIADVQIWRCVGDGEAHDGCGSCDPYGGTNITVTSTATFDITTGLITWEISTSDAGLSDPTTLEFFVGDIDPSCCAGYSVGLSGTVPPDWNALVGAAPGEGVYVVEFCAPGPCP